MIVKRRKRIEENFTETDLLNCNKSLKFIKKKNKILKKKFNDASLTLCDQQVKQEFEKYSDIMKKMFPETTDEQLNVLYKDLMNKQSFVDTISDDV
jgi:hypothetical protein